MSQDHPNETEKTEAQEARPFIRETVIQEEKRTPFWKKLVLTLFLGLVFGAVAAVSAYFTHRFLPGGEETTTTPYAGVSFQTDVDPEQASTEAPYETQPTQEPAETREPNELDAMIDARINAHNLEIKDFRRMYSVLSSLTTTVSRSLVTVTATNEEQDWFQTDYQFDTKTFGVIVAITSQEVLIAAPAAPTAQLSEDSSLKVTFANLITADAYTKATDSICGIAVLAVPVANLSAGTVNSIAELQLGNSYACTTGQPVFAMGSPAGYIKSIRYGILSFVETGHSTVDNTIRVLHTDISGDENSAGILVNSEGYLIGWIDPDLLIGGCLSAVGISDLKSYLENLTNGISNGYLGIEGVSVTAEMAREFGLEGDGGVFITRCVEDSPAQNAGLQSGDILIRISEQPVTDMNDLRTRLLSMNTEQTVKVTVLRQSRKVYQELTFDVKIERR
ncbi:MAG: PDZ domain-containing protein [Lachnospiraceae bacterium]|nr:PDZ domain-containing protein [Lachnospiraceae bacterium]